MRLIRGLFRGLAAMAAAALLLAGCNNSSPTEPKMAAAATPTPTPLPPGGNIAGAWTGTYVSTDSVDCDTSIVFPAQATLSQNGSVVSGTLAATGDLEGCPCGNLTFAGTLQGNALAGTIKLTGFSWGLHGTLSGSTLDIVLTGSPGNVFGQMHLHR